MAHFFMLDEDGSVQVAAVICGTYGNLKFFDEVGVEKMRELFKHKATSYWDEEKGEWEKTAGSEKVAGRLITKHKGIEQAFKSSLDETEVVYVYRGEGCWEKWNVEKGEHKQRIFLTSSKFALAAAKSKEANGKSFKDGGIY